MKPTAEALSEFSAEALQVAAIARVVPLLNHIATNNRAARQDSLSAVVLRQRLTEILLLTQVLDSWHQAGRLGENGSPDEQDRRQLFLGTGGRYGAADLRARASMLETLGASIRVLYEQLEVLMREIVEQTADVS